MHGDITQLTLHVTTCHKTQAARVVCDAFGVDEECVAHSHGLQGRSCATAQGETEVFAIHLRDERDCAAFVDGIRTGEGDTCVLPHVRRGEPLPLRSPMAGKDEGDHGEPSCGVMRRVIV